jgi:hypothetical protein
MQLTISTWKDETTKEIVSKTSKGFQFVHHKHAGKGDQEINAEEALRFFERPNVRFQQTITIEIQITI